MVEPGDSAKAPALRSSTDTPADTRATPASPPAHPPGKTARAVRNMAQTQVLIGLAVLLLPVVLIAVVGGWSVWSKADDIKANFDRVERAERAAAQAEARQRQALQDQMVARFNDCIAKAQWADATKVLENMNKVELDQAVIDACAAKLKQAQTPAK